MITIETIQFVFAVLFLGVMLLACALIATAVLTSPERLQMKADMVIDSEEAYLNGLGDEEP